MANYQLGESFRWFIARVIDINDPEKLGRVKIRVIHEQTGELGKKVKTFGILDEDLLWAYPISAIQSASLSWKKITELEKFETPDWIDAVGLSPTGLAVSSYVYGFYLDGHEANIPLIFGTYHKMSRYPEPPPSNAPVDGEESLLQMEPPQGETFFYSDIAALAKGFYEDPQRPEVNGPGQTLPKDPHTVSTLWGQPEGKAPVDEPPSAYATVYPYNTTYTTKSGHAIEMDDTPGSERIHIWHKSGCYEEISNGPPGENTDQDGAKKDPNYPKGPVEYVYTTAGGITEPSWSGRRNIVTNDNYNSTIRKDKNELIQRDHNVEIANTQITRLGATTFISSGYGSPTGNRDPEDGKTYADGGLDKGYLYVDTKETAVHTVDKNFLISVNKGGPDGEYRFSDDEKGNYRLEVANNANEEIGNNHIVTIANNQNITIGNNQTVSVGANCTVSIADHCTVSIGQNCTIIVGGNARVTVSGQADVSVGGNMSVTAGGTARIASTGAMDITSSSAIRMSAPTIDLN